MPPRTPADATLVLEHVVGDLSYPGETVSALLARLPTPSNPTPRFRRGILLRRLAADPVSESSHKTLHLLALLPASASPIAAAYTAVAAFLVASAPDFDAAARLLFARPDSLLHRAVDKGRAPALASAGVIATADQFVAAVGNSSSQTILRDLWGNRAAAEERVRELLAAEWAAIQPSMLEAAAERIIGDGAVETWRAADEATRAKFRILAGEEKTREILSKLEERTSSANQISTPAVEKTIDTLKTSCADLHSVVEDPLPAAKAAADELLAARMGRRVRVTSNAEEVRGHPTTCGAAGPSTLNDKDQGPSRGKPHNIMDRNPTAQTFQWEESPGPEGPESSLHRPHLASPSRIPVSPLRCPENKSKRRRAWSVLEEDTLRNGVQEYGQGNWKGILDNYADVFIGRTTVNLKDKWRNMNGR